MYVSTSPLIGRVFKFFLPYSKILVDNQKDCMCVDSLSLKKMQSILHPVTKETCIFQYLKFYVFFLENNI